MQLLTSIELFESASYYAKHSHFVEIQKYEESGFYSKDSLFNLSLSDTPSRLFKRKNCNKRTKEQCLKGETTDNGKKEDPGNHEQCIEEEAQANTDLKHWSPLLCVLVLTNVLRLKVRSFHLESGNGPIVKIFNTKFAPRNSPFRTDVSVNLLWSRSGALDNTPDREYTPNHFVPLIAVSITAARNTRSTESIMVNTTNSVPKNTAKSDKQHRVGMGSAQAKITDLRSQK